MGFGGYSYQAHQAIVEKRSALPVEQVFRQKSCHPLMNPKGVKFRESRDSQEHPESISIAFALDVSGSMGEIPNLLARKELPTFMKTLVDSGIDHAQVLFMAFTDVESSPTPLQVGQFESTAELMDKWLTLCHLEGGGQTQYENYDLPLYFAARHTKMDCWEKRKHKGYLFITGDEPNRDTLPKEWVDRVIGGGERNLSIADVVQEAGRMFEVFFLIPDAGRAKKVGPWWETVLGPRVLRLDNPGDTCAVAAGAVAVCEGVKSGRRKPSVERTLEPWIRSR